MNDEKQAFKKEVEPIDTIPSSSTTKFSQPDNGKKCRDQLEIKPSFKIYVCPFHPGFIHNRPGQCLECGSNLVTAY